MFELGAMILLLIGALAAFGLLIGAVLRFFFVAVMLPFKILGLLAGVAGAVFALPVALMGIGLLAVGAVLLLALLPLLPLLLLGGGIYLIRS